MPTELELKAAVRAAMAAIPGMGLVTAQDIARAALEAAERVRPAADAGAGWRPIATAPRDGTLVDLYVPQVEEHPLADDGGAVTIGMNNFDRDGIDRWQFAGWCWQHDHFTEGKGGAPTHWRPRPMPPDGTAP